MDFLPGYSLQSTILSPSGLLAIVFGYLAGVALA